MEGTMYVSMYPRMLHLDAHAQMYVPSYIYNRSRWTPPV